MTLGAPRRNQSFPGSSYLRERKRRVGAQDTFWGQSWAPGSSLVRCGVGEKPWERNSRLDQTAWIVDS